VPPRSRIATTLSLLVCSSACASPGVKTNRRLPVARYGVVANFLVGAAGPDDSPVAFGNRTRHCYASSVGNDFGDPALHDCTASPIPPLGSAQVVATQLRAAAAVLAG
jgi:hypothetical protein